MEARPVDPRDAGRAEDHPTYRVYFWERLSYVGVPQEQSGYRSESYDISGVVDVREVLTWAEENAGPNRTFAIYAILDRCEIRLLGQNPTQSRSLT